MKWTGTMAIRGKAAAAVGKMGTETATPNVLTVDLEDWFHCLEPDRARWNRYERRVEPVTDALLELLEERHTTATFFVLGDVAQVTRRLVGRIAAAGHEIGSHGMDHQFIYRQGVAGFRDDLHRSIELLGDIVGHRVISYRAPYFSITEKSLWAFDVLAEEGIVHDSSVFPVRNHRYGIATFPRLPHEVRPGLTEWPLSCVPTPIGNLPCSGGVYLRVLPWMLSRTAADALVRRGDPIVAYLHPWELDPGQPVVADVGSAFLRWRHYRGLGQMEGKVRRLVERFSFTSIAGAAAARAQLQAPA